jgi:hypothetical protein
MCYYDSAFGDYSNADFWADPRNTRVSSLLPDENQSTIQLDKGATIPNIHVSSEGPTRGKRKRKDVDLSTSGPSTGTHDVESRGSEEVA